MVRISLRICGGTHGLREAVVERRKAEAHQVRRAEIADHAARDQRLHHCIAFAMGEADVAAALRWVARGSEGNFVAALRLDRINEGLG